MWYYLLMKSINVLSLFDGMSCGQIALERAGIKVNKYFSSEIDKYAIAVTQYHYPDTVQLGDVISWQDWHLPKIDLLLGGSPCQGFSIAGKRLNWRDPRSQLFFRYVDCLRWYKPTWFLFENVSSMAKEVQKAISQELDVEPIRINSSLISAQNRDRLYWSNIPNISQSKDKEIYIKDILEDVQDIEEKYFVRTGHAGREKTSNQKAGCLTGGGNSGGNHSEMTLIKTIPHGYIKESEKEFNKYPSLCAQSPASKHIIRGNQHIKISITNRKAGITKKNLLKSLPILASDWRGLNRNQNQTSIQTTIQKKGNREYDGNLWRRLTIIECERLQTVEDDWTLVPFKKRMMSNTRRYKMLGDGWTIDVIVHILSHILNREKEKIK